MRHNLRKIFLWIGVFIVFTSWAVLSWKRWPDCLGDFGRELYIPWQISQGKVLYYDIYYSGGPLSQYFNAFLFKLFGASLAVLLAKSLICIILISFLLYSLFKSFYNSLSGIAAVYIFLGIFAFGHYLFAGCYNFISPYSYELVDGFALSLGGLFFIKCWLKAARIPYLAATGILLGLVALTRTEVFLAFFGAVVLAVILNTRLRHVGRPVTIKNLCVLFCFVLIAPLFYFIYLSQHMLFDLAVKSFSKSLFSFQDPKSDFDQLSNIILGQDRPLTNLWVIIKVMGGYVLTLSLLGILANMISYFKSKKTRSILLFISGILAFLVYVFIRYIHAYLIFRGVPFVLLIFILIKSFQFLKKSIPHDRSVKLAFQIVLMVYSLILTFKIFLSVTPFQYGFVLALPGAICAMLLLINEVSYFGKFGLYRPNIFRTLLVILLAGILILHFRWSKSYYEHINYSMAKGRDAFLAYDANVSSRSVLVDSIVQWLSKNTTPADTLVVMPDGVIINYLSKRINPGHLITFDQESLAGVKEDEEINFLKNSMPTYIIFVQSGSFGVEYGHKILQWVLENYKISTVWFEQPSPMTGGKHIVQAIIMNKKGISVNTN